MPLVTETKEQPWRLLGHSPTGTVASFDQSRFTNDGDCVLWIEKLALYTELAAYGFSIRPSNGPPWSRDPLPIPHMGAMRNSSGSEATGTSAMWHLEHPYPLNPHDSFQITANYGVNWASLARGTVSMWGRKELGVKTAPPRYNAPCVFTDSIVSAADGDVIKFNTEKLRNWHDSPVELHWLTVYPYRIDTELRLMGQDTHRIRARMGMHAIIGKNTMVPYASVACANGWRVPFYGMKLDPGVALEIEIQRNISDAGNRTFLCAVYGSVEVVRANHV